MIDTIIFDFGDVFINLEKERCEKAFLKLGLPKFNDAIMFQNDLYEKGLIDETTFLSAFQKYIPNASLKDIKHAWNKVLCDFPQHRLDFLQLLSTKYRLFLLTNTDKTHMAHFERKVGASFYTAFYRCFEKVCYSYELKQRKPDSELFTKMIDQYHLSPKKTLFIDDKKENTDSAQAVGMHVWNLQVGHHEVTDLLTNNILNK